VNLHLAATDADLPKQAGLLESAEFRTRQFEGYYNSLLHRPDDAVGLNAWVSSDRDAAGARVGFEMNDEFFAVG
jgi:hypothetical protein